MDKLRLSKYSVLFQKEGESFLYNSRTNSFYKLPSDTYKALEAMKTGDDCGSLPSEFISLLKEKKIVATEDEDQNYLDYLRICYMHAACGSPILGLTILPTISCNLHCPYCFENNKPAGVMSDDTIAELVKFIKNNAVAKKYSITWFGGEPLLGLNSMENYWTNCKRKKNYNLRDIPSSPTEHCLMITPLNFLKDILSIPCKSPLTERRKAMTINGL